MTIDFSEPPKELIPQNNLLRTVVLAAHLVWNSFKVAPSVQNLMPILKSTDPKLIQETLDSEDFAFEMARHGVPWRENQALTDQQMLAIMEVSNPLSGRSFTQRLQAAGISHLEWVEWRKNPIFDRYFTEMSQDLLTVHKPELRMALMQEGLKGNIRAIEYIDSITEPRDDQAKKLADLEVIFKRVLEIIQEEVPEPERLTRIAAKLKIATAQAQVIESVPVPQSLTSSSRALFAEEV